MTDTAQRLFAAVRAVITEGIDAPGVHTELHQAFYAERDSVTVAPAPLDEAPPGYDEFFKNLPEFGCEECGAPVDDYGRWVRPAPLDVEVLARAMYNVDAWDDNSIDRQRQIEDAGLVAAEYRAILDAEAKR